MVGRSDLSDLERVLKISGHLVTFPRFKLLMKLLQRIRTVFIPVMAPLALYSVYLGGIEGLYRYAFFSIAGILMSQHAIYFLPREKEINDVISCFKDLLKTRKKNWQIEIFNKDSTPLWWLVNLYLSTCVVFVVFYSFVPFFVDAYLAFFTNAEPFRLPTPAEPFLGENPERSVAYYVIYFLGSFWSGLLTSHSCGTECMCYVFLTYLCTELKVIDKKIKRLGKDFRLNKNEYCKIKLREIIKDHQNVMKIGSQVNNLLGTPLVFQNVISTMTITLLTFTATVQIHRGNILIAFGAIFPLNCFFWMILSICFLGERLQGHSKTLSESLYELPWYEMDVEMRKEILMMLRQSSKPMVIDYRHSSAISLAIFQKMINESYSYLMVLKSIS